MDWLVFGMFLVFSSPTTNNIEMNIQVQASFIEIVEDFSWADSHSFFQAGNCYVKKVDNEQKYSSKEKLS